MIVITKPSDVLPLIKELRLKRQEHFGVIGLDSGRNILFKKILFKGGVKNTLVDVKVLFWEVCKKNSCAIIIFHNHPSGDVLPSEEDLETTEHIKKGCEALGIPMLDHIIMGYYSQVAIIAENKAFNRIEETVKKHKWQYNITKKETYGYITFDEIKWYNEFHEVSDVMNLLYFFEGINEDGFGFKFIQLGEDNNVIRVSNKRGDDEFPDLDVEYHIYNSY